METSNLLPVGRSVTSISSTAETSSVQPGSVTSPLTQVPQAPAIVPLQQLNLQQSLLLQQYAFSHQLITSAVKSPAEIAAARAAEISKKLEESGAVGDKESLKKSKSRSKTKSISHSRSRSKSRSPAVSPVKRRRRHSRSLSPIRYRRDYYSSYGSRDYYGYRGHNYRSYYRGNYNDYSRYRYDRDHEYHYRRRSRSRERRGSRTRSPRMDRNRGRRRSPTLSPPVPKRSDTASSEDLRKPSPSLPGNRDRPRSKRASQQSLSREASEGQSVSSGSVNPSPISNRSRSEGQEKSVEDQKVEECLHKKASEEIDEKQLACNLKMPKGSNGTKDGGTQSSSSPARSLSVSFGSDKYTSSSNEVSAKKRHEIQEQCSSEDNNNETISSGKKFAPEVQESKSRQNQFGHRRRSRKLTQSSHSISEDDAQSAELVDDWRDDLKQTLKGENIFVDEEENDIFLDRPKSKSSESDLIKRGGCYAANANTFDLMEESVVHSSRFAAPEDSLTILKEPRGISNQDSRIVLAHGSPEKSHLLMDLKELPDGYDDSQPSNAEELVFEGPQPATTICDGRKQSFEEGTNFDAHFWKENARKEGYPIFVKTMEVDKTSGCNDGHLHHLTSEICDAEDKDEHKSKSGASKKRETGLTQHSSRSDKHRRHKKRRKSESMDEDTDLPKKRHKKKHRRESKHSQRERNKKRHKHKSRLSSTEDSSSADELDAERTVGKKRKSSKKRRSSKRHLSRSTSTASLA